jgi:glycosyltransferase involved in cell wall biosynthesis
MPDPGAAGPRVVVVTNMVTPYTNNLYNRLHDDGVQLTVLTCSRREPNRLWDVTESRFPRRVLPGLVIKISTARFAHFNPGVGRALAQLAPDVVFINGFYPTMILAAIWARLHGVKLALTIDGWAETMPNTVYHRLVRPLILSWCRAVVTPGRKGSAYFVGQGFPPERIACVPLVPAWQAPAEVPGFAERRFHLLWCAHLNKSVKNVEFFLSLAEVLKRSLPELRVRIVGAGEAEAEVVARLERAGIAYTHDRYVPWNEMAAVYGQARVLVLPSLWEPWGLVCDEALICGVPCVVSPHVGAGDDSVRPGVNGYVLGLDVDQWSCVVLGLVTDDAKWTTLSSAARRLPEERSIPRSARSFEATVQAVLAD